jgi:hypothetical protein
MNNLIVFGRYELSISLLAFMVEGTLVDHWLQQIFGDIDGGKSYFEALARGHLTNGGLLVMLVGDGLLFSWFGAFLAYILRKYREAQVFGQLARAMPPRWVFEIGGISICVVSILVSGFLVATGVMEYFRVAH